MRRALVIPAALAAAGAGCSKARTEAVVVVDTAGLRIPDDIDTIQLRVADAADAANPVFDSKFHLCGADVQSDCLALPLDFALIPGAHRDHSSRVQVTAWRRDSDVIDDAAVFTFADGQSLRLDFVLYANCLGNVDCAARDEACGPDAACQPVPAVPIHGDPDFGAGGGGEDLAGAPDDLPTTPDDLTFTPADLSTAPLDMPMPLDMSTPPDMSMPPDMAHCTPLCALGSCGLSSCGTPCTCAANEHCDTSMMCQPNATDMSGGGQVLTWTSKTFDSGSFYGVWGSGNVIYAVGNYAGSSAVFYNSSSIDPLDFAGDTRYPTMVTLDSVFGRSASDLYAAGPGGLVVHFDGTKWVNSSASMTVDVNGVWVGGPGDDAWVVGGTISNPGSDPYGFAHYNSTLFGGTHWATTGGTGRALQSVWGDGTGFIMMVADETSVMYSAAQGSSFSGVSIGGTDNPLYGVFGLSPTQMYTVGGNGTIWRLNYKASTMILGSTKETLSPPTTTALYGVAGTTGDLWAVGANNTIYHSTGGGTWTKQTNLPTPDNFTNFRGVWALGPNDVYVVGSIMGTKVIVHGQ